MQAYMLFLSAFGFIPVKALDKCQSQKFSDFARALGPVLSPGASINFPGTDEFANATTRFSAYGAPDFAVTVDVATEGDVDNVLPVSASAHPLLGPGLGGGHGWNQGRYGLGLDQIVEANLVLGDGSRIVVSEDSHADLFWGLRGAGHNFGIYTFTQDKLEALFGLLDSFVADGAQPVELRHWVTFMRVPEIDPIHAVLATWIVYEGTPERASPYTSKMEALGPATTTFNTTAYPGIVVLMGMDRGAVSCLENGDHVLRFPIDVRGYNLTAHRAAYTIFDEVSGAYPALSGATMLNEGYSVRAVQAVPADNTAYPDRFNNLLLSASFRVKPNAAAEDATGGMDMDQIAIEAGLKIRRTLFEGGGSPDLYTYVNYGLGLETLENYYGYEDWRLARLRELKAKYDPDRKFSFYAPIE
ncbi:uncharacterized protein PG986_001429 [Apiospora aurea]|uniref:Berberine/berberine-like domain-containing protein n=1 Tax=Apiospora aurea TaxID=335848 RepID=A0ABR1QWS8_9PEZI